MIKNIIFDWSGVISDDLYTVYKASMVIFKNLGAREISFDEFKKEWEQPYVLFYQKYGITKVSREEEVRVFNSAYESVVSQYPTASYPHIVEVLHRFKEAGINMIILSAKTSEFVLLEIKDLGLEDIFSEVNSDAHDKSEVIHEIIERNQFNPKDTIFVGDTTHEVYAGKSAGTITGAVTWGYQNEDKLKSSNPDFMIYSPKELESIVLK